VADNLLPGDALVSYARYRHLRRVVVQSRAVLDTSERYLAFVVRGGESPPHVVALDYAAVIDSTASAWHVLAAREPASLWANDHSEAECAAIGRKLRQQIWDPLGEVISGARRVIVVPDGLIQLVNLSALPNADSTYLVETAPPIQLLSAERDLGAGAADSSSNGLLAVGGATFGSAAASPTEVEA